MPWDAGVEITVVISAEDHLKVLFIQQSPLVFETDAPDMPLAVFQGQANRPERIGLVFEALCNLRQELAEEIATQLYNNSLQLFNIKKEQTNMAK